MGNIGAIPEAEKNWLGKDVFTWKGQTWMYMGAWAGWMRADAFRPLEGGGAAGYAFEPDEKRSAEAQSALKNAAQRLAPECGGT
ncbi:MAG TPA: hypothetical protein PLP20_00065 [Oscillospiraceae bacterium]|nr:hypothetical protein [Oscillospiraceae bacterium]HNW04055.1 hypothetical protein [Oscillospiraceae bacterium]HPV99438.1 hypothetical protein [Oscillospiraceae bacterium]